MFHLSIFLLKDIHLFPVFVITNNVTLNSNINNEQSCTNLLLHLFKSYS